MERPKGRRSSILSQTAQREGYEFQVEKHMAELVKQLPPSVLSNAARHSAGLQISRRSSAANSTISEALQPTPVNKLFQTFAGRGGSASKQSSIPRAVRRPPVLSEQGRSGSVRRGGSVSRGGSANRSRMDTFVHDRSHSTISNSTIRRPPRPAQSMSALPRSTSTDSLFTPSSLATPRFSRSPGKITFSEKGDTVGKTLKAPPATDKRAINLIGLLVNNFLQDQQYQHRMSLDNLNKMSLSQYLEACRFILQLMMGPTFLATVKGDDLSTKLLELSVLLKYPGTLSKSVLKSPNTTHSWPSALTFLVFLCCRVEAAITPVPLFSDHPINEIKDPESYSDDQKVESYCRMFLELISCGKYSLELELDAYQSRLRGMASDSSESMEELLALSEQKRKYLEEKLQEEDPRAALLETEECQDRTIIELKKKKAELQAQLRKFGDVGAVVARRSTLTHNLESLRAENKKTDEILKNQVVDVTTRKILLKEIDELGLQRGVVEQVNAGTRRTFLNREQFVSTAQHRFYDVCCRLNVSNVFNEHLQKLEHMREVEGMERMTNSPFDAEALRPWLKATRRVHRHTKQILNQLNDQLQDTMDKIQSTLTNFEEQEFEREHVIEDIEKQTEFLRVSQEKDFARLQEEANKISRAMAIAKEDINNASALCSKVDEQLQEANEEMLASSSENDKLLTDIKSLDDKKVNKMKEIETFEGPFIEAVQKLMTEHVERRRQIILDGFGVDILKEPEDDPEEGTA